MRQRHCSLNARVVTASLVAHLAACLCLRDYHASVPAKLLARLLLLCAATRQSLSYTAQHCDKAPSAESVRLALLDNLPDTAAVLLDRLHAALHAALPRAVRRRRMPCALDLHLRPYYGDKNTPGVTGGPHEAGTDYFWAYGTLVVLTKGLRLTVALCQADRKRSLATVVAALLDQAQAAGVRIAWLMLDRAFYDAQVIRLLQQRGVPFALPAIRRGDKTRATGTQRFFRADCAAGWHDYQWRASPKERTPEGGRRRGAAFTVAVRVCVYRPEAGKTWVFVAGGLSWEPALLARRYRRRFGIETSYRQLGQSLTNSSSNDERVRLLYVGLALLLRQEWARLHYDVLAVRLANGHHRLQPPLLRLAELLLWLLLELSVRLRVRLEVPSPQPYTTIHAAPS
jgi:hypothetical protein